MSSSFSARHLAARARSAARVAIEVVDETGSTNADLMPRLPALDAPLLRLAHRQTAGRGRAGRRWETPPGDALAFSLAWRFRRPMQGLAGLPLAVGVAVADALQRHGVPVALKWPNDVLRDGAKLAGILIEAGPAAPDGGARVVVGIGINGTLPPGWSERIGRPAAGLPPPEMVDRCALAAALLDALADALDRFDADGLAPFVPAWNARHAYAGESVRILDRDRLLHEGVAAGVDASGCLLLDTAAGRIAIAAGDVSLRAAA